MRVGAVDGAEDGPHLFVVGEVHDLVPARPPQTVVVADHEFVGGAAAEAARGIGVLDGELRALQHLATQRLLVRGAAGGHRDRRLDRAEEPDLDAVDTFRLRDLAAVAAVGDGFEEEALVGLDEVAVGRELGRGVAVDLRCFSRNRRGAWIVTGSRNKG